MMIPSFGKLYKPYMVDGATFNGSLNYLLDKCKFSKEIVERVAQETMLKLADGVKFSIDGCSCGCGMTNAHSAIEHYMRDRCYSITKEANIAFNNVVEGNLRVMILNHISLENQKYISKSGMAISAKYPSKWQVIKNKVLKWIGLQ